VQTILVTLDPRMVRVHKCVCLADPWSVCICKKTCGSESADIRVRSPHTSGTKLVYCRRSGEECAAIYKRARKFGKRLSSRFCTEDKQPVSLMCWDVVCII